MQHGVAATHAHQVEHHGRSHRHQWIVEQVTHAWGPDARFPVQCPCVHAHKLGPSSCTEGSPCLQVRPNILELQLQGKRKVNPHYLESYRTALQAAMLLPFGRRGTPHDRAGVLALGQQPVLRAILAAEGCVAALGPAQAQGFLCRPHLRLPAFLQPVGFALAGLMLTTISSHRQAAGCQGLWHGAAMPLHHSEQSWACRVDWEVMQEVHTSGKPLQPGKAGRPVRSSRTEPSKAVTSENSDSSTPKCISDKTAER